MDYDCYSKSDEAPNYFFIPADFQKHAKKVIADRDKKAGKSPVSSRKSRTKYLWGYQHDGRKPALEKAKERITNADK